MPLKFQDNIKFRNVPEEAVEEFNFDGGLVKDKNETKLQSNQSPEIYNVLFNETGSIKTRSGYTRYTGDVIASSSDESNTGTSTGTFTLDNYADYVSQSFQVGTDASIVQCDFYLEMNTSGETQYMKAELWSYSSGPSAKIADGQILLVSGTSETEYSFRFRLPYELTASTDYAVVLRPFVRGSTNTINTVLVHYTGDDYASGSAWTSTNAGVAWSESSSIDLKFNIYTGGDTGCTGLIRFYGESGVQQTISKFGSSLYTGSSATAITFPSGVSLDSAAFIDWTVSNGTLLVTDGTNEIKKYRGSTNSAYTTGTISVTNDSTAVTGSGTSWNTSTNAEAGEYIKLPDNRWYKITSIGSDTSLVIERTYQGNTSSGDSYIISPWGDVQGRLSSAATPTAPTPTYIENHSDRIWTLEENRLRFSVLDTSVTEEHFNDWDTANNAGQIIIPGGKGDVCTGLYSLNNGLYVFQRRAIWRLYGNSPANFELRNVSNEIGMIDRRSLVEWNDLLIFLSDEGIYYFDGSNLSNVSNGVVNQLIDTWANKSSAVATLWDNKYIIAYTTSGSSENNEILMLDLTRNIFSRFKGVYASAFSSWTGGTDNGEIYFGSSNQGTIYKWDTGSNDDGYEIETIYETPSLSFGKGINDKAIKKFYLQQLALGDWDMTVTATLDVDSTTLTSTINLSDGTSSLWDVMEWDTDNWSSEGTIITNRIPEFQGIAKYFRFRFYQKGYDEGVDILGMVATSRMRRLR